MDKLFVESEKTDTVVIIPKWRRSGSERRQQRENTEDIMEKREANDRRKGWLDTASKIIYQEH